MNAVSIEHPDACRKYHYICCMIYHAIGTMSGSSMDGLDIVYCTLQETGGQWSYTIHHADCLPFNDHWNSLLPRLTLLNARELLQAHVGFGHWMGTAIRNFIETHGLHHKIHLIASHGHTVFHDPSKGMTFQMGDGAAIAAETSLPVVSDLRNMDVALGGQGAPIVPIGEKLLWKEYSHFLNIGGICNITIADKDAHLAFDVCAANRVLNLLASELGKTYDEGGEEAAKGKINSELLYQLNELDYYKQPYPKSLSNEFGTDIVLSVLNEANIPVHDRLHTYCIHIAAQVAEVCDSAAPGSNARMLITGGGACNNFLIQCLRNGLDKKNIDVVVPDEALVSYKEALVMALIGVLRWREEYNVLSSVSGASRNSVGGALWMGQE